MISILLAVQGIEILWAVLNLFGVERVTTEDTVRFVGDIHLSYMPYSHSILTSLLVALIAGVGFFLTKKSWRVAWLMGAAFLSHIVLDIITHAQDLPLTFADRDHVGLGLYGSWPLVGFLVETGFGIFCWWYYKGSKALFWVILLFNLANITMFLPQVSGPEYWMAHKPMLIAGVILAQIITTLVLVGWLATAPERVRRKLATSDAA